MNYIKPSEADAVPQMPDWAVSLRSRPFQKQIQQEIWQFCFQFPWHLTEQTGSTGTVTPQNPRAFNQAKGMKNIHYVTMVCNYECCLHSQLAKNWLKFLPRNKRITYLFSWCTLPELFKTIYVTSYIREENTTANSLIRLYIWTVAKITAHQLSPDQWWQGWHQKF